MRKFFNILLIIATVLCVSIFAVGCSQEGTPSASNGNNSTPSTLAAPVLSKNGLTFSWTEIENASGYIFRYGATEVQLSETTYTFTTEKAGNYNCYVKAKGDGVNFEDSDLSNILTVLIERDAPVLSLETKTIQVVAGSSFIVNAENLGVEITDASDFETSYSVKRSGEEITLTENSFTVGTKGFYEVAITAEDAFGAKSTAVVYLVVEGTYLYSFDAVTDIDNGVDWFVRNSSKGGSTACRIKTEENGNKYYELTADAGEKTTFNMPLPKQGEISVEIGRSYKVFLTLWTEERLVNDEKIEFSAVSPMINAKGKLDADNNKVVLTALFSPTEGRISTFYIQNDTGRQIKYCIDDLTLVEIPSWSKMPVDIGQGSDEVDADGNLKSVFSRADSWYTFYPASVKDCTSDDIARVTLTYKIESEVPMADARGALGSYKGGTLFLQNNSQDFVTVTFDAGLDVENGKGCLKIVFITAVDSVIYISDMEVEVLEKWGEMPVDITQGSDEVDADGNLKSVFTRADSEFTFYPDEIQNLNARARVKVTLTYKIESEVPMADARGALGSYNGGTLFLKANQGYETINFDTYVSGQDKKYIKITFISAVSAAMHISEFKVEAYKEWQVMPVDIQNGSDTVDADGNLKSVFEKADSKFVFYADSIKDVGNGDAVKVTLTYKIVSKVAMADKRGALGSYSGGTLFLQHNTDDFITVTFDTKVEVENDMNCVKITFITAEGAEMLIKEFNVELPKDIEVGLGGNVVYFLPSTTGMQSLAFIIENDDNEIFVIDGGYSSKNYGGNDAKQLYDYICKIKGTGAKTVKGWFLTHPHSDHIGCFGEFMQTYGNEVTVEKIYYSWSEEKSWYVSRKSIEHDDVGMSNIAAVKEAVSQFGITHVEPVTGDTFDFGSFTFEILYSPKNTTTANGGTVGDYGLNLSNYGFVATDSTKGRYNVNDLSLVIKMTTSEKSILFLADAGVEAGEWLYEAYKETDKLKADIVQMAHHGQAGVEENVYQLVAPKIALFSCDAYVYNNVSGTLKTLIVREWMKKLGAKNYVSKDGAYVFS